MVPKVFKSFKPGILGTTVLFLCATGFSGLGSWQLERSAGKAALEKQFQSAALVPKQFLEDNMSRFSRIEVRGHYDTVHHILLDNQTLNGRTGVHVFTPFHTLEGITILVNRGWLPMDADRRSLPDVPTTPNKTILRGILNHAPVPGRTLGEADQLDRNQWPQLVTYLNIEDVASVLETPLNGQIIQLLKSEQDGFEGRSWKPVFLSSDRHLGYAVQWYAFAILSIGLWIIVGVKTNGKSNE